MNLDVPRSTRPAFRAVSIFLMLLAIAILPSCGSSSGSSGGGGGGSNTPKRPILDSISPRNVTIGGPAFTLTLTGAQFSPSDIVLWTFMGTQTTYSTTFVSSTELTISVPASAIANPGRASILVQFQGEKLYSGSQSLGILPPIPFITSLSPPSIPAGSNGFTLTVNGGNFLPSEGVDFGFTGNENFAGSFNPTQQFVSSTQFTIQIPASAIAYPGIAEVTVSFGGDAIAITSNEVAFTITAVPGVPPFVPTLTPGVTPNGNSSAPMVSDTGRFVTFSSQATNLVPGGTNFPEVYVTDTCLGAPVENSDGITSPCVPTTLLVSAEPAGSPVNPIEGNGSSSDSSIADQESATYTLSGPPLLYFSFLSNATNLVLPATASQQAFFRETCYLQGSIDGCTPQTVLISASQNNVQANGPATDVAIDQEACNAVFVSSATNVIAGVTTPNEIYFAQCNLSNSTYSYVPIAVVSESNSGVPGDQGASEPVITYDLVAFASASTNLTSTPNGGFQQIYLRTACIGLGSSCTTATTMISVDGSGNALAGNSENPAMTQDGRFVAFTNQAPSGGGTLDTVYRYDNCDYEYSPGLLTGCTPGAAAMSVGASGATANGSSDSGRHALSLDGRFVAFHSQATNLIAGGNPAGQVFVRDTCLPNNGDLPPVPPNCVPTTNMVSINNGVAIGGSQEAISADGHFVVFVTTINGIQQVVLAYTGF